MRIFFILAFQIMVSSQTQILTFDPNGISQRPRAPKREHWAEYEVGPAFDAGKKDPAPPLVYGVKSLQEPPRPGSSAVDKSTLRAGLQKNNQNQLVNILVGLYEQCTVCTSTIIKVKADPNKKFTEDVRRALKDLKAGHLIEVAISIETQCTECFRDYMLSMRSAQKARDNRHAMLAEVAAEEANKDDNKKKGAPVLPRPTGAAMAAPMTMGKYDRLAFVRFRKVGSTSLQQALIGDFGFCSAPCDFQTCMYRRETGCSQVFKCAEKDQELSGYPCSHQSITMISHQFRTEAGIWAQIKKTNQTEVDLVQAGQLYPIVLLRDPNKRALSEFYYAKNTHMSKDWKNMFPIHLRSMIIEGDLRSFIKAGDGNGAMNGMTLQLIGELGPTLPDSTWKKKTITPRHDVITRKLINKAMHYLRQCRIVLLAEYMPQGLMLVRHVLGLPMQTTERAYVSRKSPVDEERLRAEADTELMARLTQATWADQLLYEEAKAIFFGAFQAMLEAKGEVVTNIEESLAKYDVEADESLITMAKAYGKKTEDLGSQGKQKEARMIMVPKTEL